MTSLLDDSPSTDTDNGILRFADLVPFLPDNSDPYRLPALIGLDERTSEPTIVDIGTAPHMLVAGSTGAGKTTCIHSILGGLLVTKSPARLRLLMIDLKRIELTTYNPLPHMQLPCATDLQSAMTILNYAVREMENRYKILERKGLSSYQELGLPAWVIVIDELADLMLQAKKLVELPLVRLAQLGRQAGIHLIVATQLPKATVVTGLLRVNIPTKICFAVPSYTDSRVVLGYKGAETLQQRGHCLLASSSTFGRAIPIHGSLITKRETQSYVNYWSTPKLCQTHQG